MPDFDYGATKPGGQYERYPDAVQPTYVQPLRDSYIHLKCGSVTTMRSDAIVRTYATNPGFYGATFCVSCGAHLPLAEFEWLPDRVPMTETRGEPGKDLRQGRGY